VIFQINEKLNIFICYWSEILIVFQVIVICNQVLIHLFNNVQKYWKIYNKYFKLFGKWISRESNLFVKLG